MGTRCGELDAGVVLHLMQQKEMSAEQLVDLLYRRSDVLGLFGISSDFRELLASDDRRARFAIDVFCYRVAGHIGSLAAALGGFDGIVFTAGVGENTAPVRSAICQACAWLGLELDEAANRAHKERISAQQPCAHLCDQDRREPDDCAPCPRAGGLRYWKGREIMPESRTTKQAADGHLFRCQCQAPNGRVGGEGRRRNSAA
jgi:hypothetical protein